MTRSLSENQNFNPAQFLDKKQSLFSVVATLLKAAQENRNIAAEFSQVFEIDEFELGENLYNHKNTNSSVSSVHGKQNVNDFYLICQGRVRLLSQAAAGVSDQAAPGREISTLVLEAGETFGADDLFSTFSLPYRAIAASPVQIAHIKTDQLRQWLPQLPALADYLQQQTQQRHCQIFFKTATELRRLPSHQLRELLPYLEAKQIAAGQSLAEVTPDNRGRYWLFQGQIKFGLAETTPNSASHHVNAQDLNEQSVSWGYPDVTPTNWIAQTDLLVYYLPIEHWQVAQEIAPQYFSLSAESNSDNGNGAETQVMPKRQGAKRSRSKRDLSPGVAPDSAADSSQPPAKSSASQPKNQSIDFPKPAKILRLPWQGYPLILQQSSSDCGAACLAMISQYWGKRFSIHYLRDLADVGRSGASLKNLAAAAESLGFHSRPVRASLSKLADQKNPWIAHWKGVHYVVIYYCKGDRFLIADPAQGKRTIPRQEFLDNWTGYALLLDPTERLKQAESQKISLGKFIKALTPYKGIIGQIILASLLIQVFGLITPLFSQIIFDRVVVQKSLSTLNVFCIGLLLFNLWGIALGSVRQYLLAYFSNRLNLTLISGFISHTLLLPLKFFESRRVGDIITRIQENQKIQRFLISQVVLAWLDLVMGFVYLGLMIYYNWRLTLLVLGLIPPIIILTLVATPMLRAISREIFQEAAQQNSLTVEMLSGISTVKAVAAEREVRWRWEDQFTTTLNVAFRGQKLGINLQVLGGSINTLGSTVLLWYGSTLVIQDQLTIGQFMAFNMMIGRVLSPFLALSGLWDRLQEILISVERLNDVFEAEPEETPGKPMLILPQLRGEVYFDNVSFRYGTEEERNTLQNITFRAAPGETIAIVGRSGSGKSTLVKLLQALYYPDSGRILIDGHDVRLVSPQSLRSQLGVVPQDCFLFSGTIMENITLYRPEFNLEQVTEVAKLAEAHTFVQDLPLGYNTKVGERGSTLSGGQRQRVAIARALLGDPRILVLDEATSSLDTESERRFQQNLERLSRDRTTFIIAHRLSTVRNADTILVLDRGILIEQGNHEELMAQQGLYYHLAQQQLDL